MKVDLIVSARSIPYPPNPIALEIMPDISVEEMNAALAEIALAGFELERRKVFRSIAIRQNLETLAYWMAVSDAN